MFLLLLRLLLLLHLKPHIFYVLLQLAGAVKLKLTGLTVKLFR